MYSEHISALNAWRFPISAEENVLSVDTFHVSTDAQRNDWFSELSQTMEEARSNNVKGG
jgi:hypothetical protein